MTANPDERPRYEDVLLSRRDAEILRRLVSRWLENAGGILTFPGATIARMERISEKLRRYLCCYQRKP